MLFKKHRAFHELQTSLRDIAAELEKSFESKTGSKINETLKNMKNKLTTTFLMNMFT